MTGAASKQNWVTMATAASVRAAKSCFQRSAAIAMRSDPSGSTSREPSGWPATWRRVKPRRSKAPVPIIAMELSKAPAGALRPPAISRACVTPASPW
jgi:hypothetical protein